MKENCAIKAFNHVNKTAKNSLIDEPEVVNFIIDSIRKCDKEPFNEKLSKKKEEGKKGYKRQNIATEC